MKIFQDLIKGCRKNLNLFSNNVLRLIKLLLECSFPKLKIIATETVYPSNHDDDGDDGDDGGDVMVMMVMMVVMVVMVVMVMVMVMVIANSLLQFIQFAEVLDENTPYPELEGLVPYLIDMCQNQIRDAIVRNRYHLISSPLPSYPPTPPPLPVCLHPQPSTLSFLGHPSLLFFFFFFFFFFLFVCFVCIRLKQDGLKSIRACILYIRVKKQKIANKTKKKND